MRTLAWSAAALLLALAGCHRAEQHAGLDNDGGTAANPTRSAMQARADANLPQATSHSARRDQAGTPAGAASAGVPPTTGASSRTDRSAVAESSRNATSIMGAAPSTVSDSSITAQVNAALAADKELHPLKIDVDTENGIVTLSGVAPTASAKAHADEVARTVGGIVSVNNQLTLAGG